MTLAQILADTKKLIGPGFEAAVGDDGLKTWINSYYLQICDDVTNTIPDFFTKGATSSTIANQKEYDLPDDLEKIVMVNLYIDGEWRRVSPITNINQIPIAERSDDLGFSNSNPRFYVIGNNIGLLPRPTTTISAGIKIWYTYTPAELGDDDEPALPKKFHHIIKYGVYANYLDQDDEHVAAERMRQRFDYLSEKYVDNLSERQIDEPLSVEISDSSGFYSNNDTYSI